MTRPLTRDRLPSCTDKVIRGDRAGKVCGRPAWWVYSGRHIGQGFVCGNHRRAYALSALFTLESYL